MNFLNKRGDIVTEYKKLLDVGRRRIKGDAPNDLEQHAEFNKLLKLNDYVYTYYSTNEGDDTYSIEFIVLSSFLEPLLEKLRVRGLWFLSKDYAPGGKYSEHYDASKNDETKAISSVITASSLGRYNLKSDESPDGWEVVDTSSDGEKTTLRREQKIHFLESDNIADIRTTYERGNYFLNMSFVRELAGQIDIDLLSKNVAVVMIEDPVVNRETLYDVLFEICGEVVQLSQDDVAVGGKSLSRKRGKSLSRKRGKRGKGGKGGKSKSIRSRKNT